jgi:hypothetical protein
MIAGTNALHAFHNRTDKPARFLSASVYYHEVALEKYGSPVEVNDPAPANKMPNEAEASTFSRSRSRWLKAIRSVSMGPQPPMKADISTLLKPDILILQRHTLRLHCGYIDLTTSAT